MDEEDATAQVASTPGRDATAGADAGPSGFVLADQPLELYRALAEQDPRAAGWYLGARITLAETRNPERRPQAAHSIRELMDKLHAILGLPPAATGGRLNDTFEALIVRWEKAKRTSKAYTDGSWSGEIDDAARKGFSAVDEAIGWHAVNRPRRRESYRATIRALDVSSRSLPAWIEDAHVEQWNDLRDYFVRVGHHDRDTDDAEFEAALHEFERFVLDRTKPRTYAEQATLEQLISEAESGA